MDTINLENDVAERDVKRQKIDAKKTVNRGKSRLHINWLNHTCHDSTQLAK